MKLSQKLSLIAIASILTACGGGGGGGTTGTSSTPTPTTPADTGLSTTIQPTTYAAGSVELALYTELNQVRLAGGFGTIAQDPVLDVAAANHSAYVVTNYFTGSNSSTTIFDIDPATGWINAHVEKAGATGFTGITPENRVTAAGGNGYQYSGEVMTIGTGTYRQCVSTLLNSIFHRSALLNTSTEAVGFGTADASAARYPVPVCTIEPAYKTPKTRPSGWVGVYPGVNQINVPVSMFGEVPNPAPEVAQQGSPVTIYLSGNLGLVNSFTLTANGSSNPVPVKQITYSDFPGYLTRSEVHILPTQPLAKGTVYNVSFKGTLASGTAVTKDWTFTTTVN